MAKEKVKNAEELKETTPANDAAPIEGIIEETVEEVVEEPTEGAATPISRSRSFIMAKYPDETFDDDELYEERLANHLEQTDKDLQSYHEADANLGEILDLNPELALIIGDMRKGMPFPVALARHVDIDDIAPFEGEPDYDEFEKSKAERLAELKSKKEREAMLMANAEESAGAISEHLESKGWTPERRAEFDAWFDNLVKRLSENRLGKEEMEIFIKGYEHDEAVKRAEENGRIAGRNEKIETKRKIQENVDDLPEGGSTSRVETTAPRRQIFNIDKMLER